MPVKGGIILVIISFSYIVKHFVKVMTCMLLFLSRFQKTLCVVILILQCTGTILRLIFMWRHVNWISLFRPWLSLNFNYLCICCTQCTMLVFKGVQGCRAKNIEFFHFFHVLSPKCPLQQISFSWSLTDHPRKIMRFQLPPLVGNVKLKVKFGFCSLKNNFDGILIKILSNFI